MTATPPARRHRDRIGIAEHPGRLQAPWRGAPATSPGALALRSGTAPAGLRTSPGLARRSCRPTPHPPSRVLVSPPSTPPPSLSSRPSGFSPAPAAGAPVRLPLIWARGSSPSSRLTARPSASYQAGRRVRGIRSRPAILARRLSALSLESPLPTPRAMQARRLRSLCSTVVKGAGVDVVAESNRPQSGQLRRGIFTLAGLHFRNPLDS